MNRHIEFDLGSRPWRNTVSRVDVDGRRQIRSRDGFHESRSGHPHLYGAPPHPSRTTMFLPPGRRPGSPSFAPEPPLRGNRRAAAARGQRNGECYLGAMGSPTGRGRVRQPKKWLTIGIGLFLGGLVVLSLSVALLTSSPASGDASGDRPPQGTSTLTTSPPALGGGEHPPGDGGRPGVEPLPTSPPVATSPAIPEDSGRPEALPLPSDSTSGGDTAAIITACAGLISSIAGLIAAFTGLLALQQQRARREPRTPA